MEGGRKEEGLAAGRGNEERGKREHSARYKLLYAVILLVKYNYYYAL